jgi:hypothetical protein
LAPHPCRVYVYDCASDCNVSWLESSLHPCVKGELCTIPLQRYTYQDIANSD